MGTHKKESSRRAREGKTGDGMANVKVKGENFYRDAKKVKVLNRFKEGKPQRNARGEITKDAAYQSREVPKARIEPNRKWFANSRVISQESLAAFRDAVKEQTSDPNAYLLKTNKLPMSLIRDDPATKNGVKQHKAKMVVETAAFGDTFGPKAQRKRVKLGLSSFSDLAGESVKMHDTYLDRLEHAKLLSGQLGADAGQQETEAGDTGVLTAARESIFSKGQSKRIWNELYKVIDSSDVVIHVLDARDPLGTRCRAIEKYLKEEAPHKHLVFVLNKCDLVPTAVAARWVRALSTEYPTLAFHASLTNSFGKGSLIALLRQFALLHEDRKQVSCGFIGYPNTGKSSIINTLRKKVVCPTAPIPGCTKVWAYITLTRRIYLIDCPGVVPPNLNDTDADILLRGVVRIENVENPSQYVESMMEKCQRRHIEKTYELKDWKDVDMFLEQLARKKGKLLKGGEPDMNSVAKVVLNDFLRGRIPWYTPPPKQEGEATRAENGIQGRIGRLGEMGRKRKREDEVEAITPVATSSVGNGLQSESADSEDGSSNQEDDESTEADMEEQNNDVDQLGEESDVEENDGLSGNADGIAIDLSSIGNIDSGGDSGENI